MDPKEAVLMHIDVKSKVSIGMHWGTFMQAEEPIDEPPKLIKFELKA